MQFGVLPESISQADSDLNRKVSAQKLNSGIRYVDAMLKNSDVL